MTVSQIKVKVVRDPVIKVKMLPHVPAALFGDNGISVAKSGVVYTVENDWSRLFELTSFDPTQKLVLIADRDGTFNVVSLASLLNNSVTTVRVITAAGDVNVDANTRVLVMNRAADETPSNIILSASANKVGSVKIIDFKGNAGTYPHTISTSGSDTFQGGLTSWSLAADGASLVLDPIPNIGYAA